MTYFWNRLRVHLNVLLLLAVSSAAARGAQDVWTDVERIVAIGDIHGDYDQFLILLRSAGLIDEKARWSGGKTHLVQTGDVLDRGPDSRKVMDLLRKLEKHSRKAGGRVHALIGNHEAMNVYGDLRYVTSGEFAAFRGKNSKRLREAYFKAAVEEAKQNSATGELPVAEASFRAEWESEHPLGYFEHASNLAPRGKYGKWIRSHNAVVKINDILFLHGGIGPKYATLPLRAINETVRKELKLDFNQLMLQGAMILDPEGPLWFRGLVPENEEAMSAQLTGILSSFEAERMVVGHTSRTGAIMPYFDGRVMAIDVGISKYYGGRLACLLIEDGKAYALHRGTNLELPARGGEALLSYLREASSLDPSPSPLLAAIGVLEASLSFPSGP